MAENVTLSSFDPNEISNISNVSYDMEDLQFSVDLDVYVPSRSDCGQNNIVETVQTKISGSGQWKSFLGGDKLKNDSSSFLTTSYTNISYQEFSKKSQGNKETLGINSIDINFDAHFYPLVTIKFTDVRASALFSPEEAVETYNQQQKKGIDSDKAYGSFFRSLFKYPYPLFLLKVKGFYGDRVTFKLAVNEFKSSFNPSTGNFDITVSFLGYMYGLYTDLPMNLVMIAPYYDLEKWRNNNYKFIGDGENEGSDICTFVEFVEKYNNALTEFSEEDLQDSQDYQNYQNLIKQRDSLDELITAKNKFYTTLNNNEGSKTPYESSKYIILIPENNSLQGLKYNEGSDTRKFSDDYKTKLDSYNTEYDEQINDEFLNTFIKNGYILYTNDKLKGIPSQKEEITPQSQVSYVLAPQTVESINQDLFNKIEADDDLKKKLINYVNSKNLKDTYIFLIKKSPDIDETFDNKLVNIKSEIDKQKNSYDKDIAEKFSKKLGFKLNIENVYRMIFAHISFFIDIFNNGVLKNIYDKKTNQLRTDGNMGITFENSDLPQEFFHKNKNSFVPPFFAYFEYNNKQQRELTYPGNASITAISKCDEVDFVEKLCESVESAGEKLVEAIKTLEETIEEVESSDANEDPNAKVNFVPTIMSDIYFNGDNPYSYYAKKLSEDKIDAEHLLYLLYYRYLSYCLLSPKLKAKSSSYIIDFEDFYANELENFKKSYFNNLSNEQKQVFISYKNDIVSSLTKVREKYKTTFFQKTFIELFNDKKGFYIFKDDIFNMSETGTHDILYENRETDETVLIREINDYLKNFIKKNELFQSESEKEKYDDVFDEALVIGKYGESKQTALFKCETDEKLEITNWKIHNDNLIDDEDDIFNFLSSYEKNDLSDYYFPTILYQDNWGRYKQNMFLTCTKGDPTKYCEQDVFTCKNLSNSNTIISANKDNIYIQALLFLSSMFTAYNDFNVFKTYYNKINNYRFIYWPKILLLYYGAMTYYRSVEDVIKPFNNGMPEDLINEYDKRSENYSIVSNNGDYFELSNHKKYLSDINNLSDDIKNTLQKYFIDWVDTEFDSILKTLSKIPSSGEVYCVEYQNKTSPDTYAVYWKHGTDQDKKLKELYGERVCICSYKVYYKNVFYSYPKDDIDFLGLVTKISDSFTEEIKEENKKKENNQNNSSSDDETSDVSHDNKYACYYMLKNLYDRWLCSVKFDQFVLSSPEEYIAKKKSLLSGNKHVTVNEFDSFLFIDSLYNDIGSDFMINPDIIIDFIKTYMSYNAETSSSVYQFMRDLAEKNNLLFIELPVFNNYTDYSSLKNIFTPNFQYTSPQSEYNTGSHLIIYTGEASHNISDDEYQGDELIDLTQNDAYSINGNKSTLPAFAVTFAKQNQMIFKSINVNMDNPKITDVSIANLLQISQAGAKGDLSIPYGIGANLFNIYSNRSYTCTVEMLGCINIMPMMYFKLNNIPMFRGYYMIINVSHSIVPGNVITKFTGVRISKNAIQRPTLSFNIQTLKQKLKINSDGTSLQKNKTEQYNEKGELIVQEGDYYLTGVTVALDSLIGENYKWKKGYKPFYQRKDNNSYKISFIVLHYTADINDEDGNVRGYGKSWNDSNKAVSADYCVGKNLIVQYNPNPEQYQSYSNAYNGKNLSRTKSYCPKGTYGSISIEMCSKNDSYVEGDDPNIDKWYFSTEVLNNTLKLCASLIVKYKMDENLIKGTTCKTGIIWTHYMSSGKPCPGIKGWNTDKWNDIGGGNNNEDALNDFRERLYNIVTNATDGNKYY